MFSRTWNLKLKVYTTQVMDRGGDITTTESGFIPSTMYTCSVIAIAADGEGPAATATATMPEDGKAYY